MPGAVSSTASNYGDCSCIHCKATKIQLFGGSKKALTLHFVFSSSLGFWRRRRKNFGSSNTWEINASNLGLNLELAKMTCCQINPKMQRLDFQTSKNFGGIISAALLALLTNKKTFLNVIFHHLPIIQQQLINLIKKPKQLLRKHYCLAQSSSVAVKLNDASITISDEFCRIQ